MTRFLLGWLFFWVVIGLVNIPVYNCFDITLAAYYSITLTISFFIAVFFDVCWDLLKAIKGGKG
jgi:hypothetical protein